MYPVFLSFNTAEANTKALNCTSILTDTETQSKIVTSTFGSGFLESPKQTNIDQYDFQMCMAIPWKQHTHHTHSSLEFWSPVKQLARPHTTPSIQTRISPLGAQSTHKIQSFFWSKPLSQGLEITAWNPPQHSTMSPQRSNCADPEHIWGQRHESRVDAAMLDQRCDLTIWGPLATQWCLGTAPVPVFPTLRCSIAAH